MSAGDIHTFRLNYPRPPKGLHANDRAHWRVTAKSKEAVRREVMLRVRSLRLGELERISVQVIWVVGDRIKRDDDGHAPLMKVICDGIGSDRGVSAHLVPDDDPAHMVKLAPVIKTVPGADPHFCVIITELDEVDA
jgi:hypothetical protein